MQQKVILGLCKYLGYKEYQHFLKANPPKKENQNNFISNFNKNKTAIGSIIITIIMGYLGYDLIKKDCMTWVNDHYEKIKCEKQNVNNVVQYNEITFANLNRIEPNCSYPFYKTDGSENLWYGKSIKGELEFYTFYGLHPETGETLDPITQYMIDKYICNK